MSSGEEEDTVGKAPTNPPTPRVEGLVNTRDASETQASPAPVEENELELDEGQSEEGGVSLQSNAASRGLLGQTMIMKRRGRYWWIFHPLTIAGAGVVLPYLVEGFACLVTDSLDGAARLAANSENGENATLVVARPSRFVGFLGEIAFAAFRQVQRFSPFDVESWGVFGSADTWDREGYPPTPAWMLQQSARIPRSLSSLLVSLREVLGISSLEAWRQMAMTFGGSAGNAGQGADASADGSGADGAGAEAASGPAVDLTFSLPILLMGFSIVSLSAARWGYQRRRELAEGSPSSGDSDHSMEVGHTLDDGTSTARDLGAVESRFGGSVYVHSEANGGGLVGSRSQRDLELDTLNSLRRDSGALPPPSGGVGSSEPPSPTDPDTSVRLTEKLLRLRETEVQSPRGTKQSPLNRDSPGSPGTGAEDGLEPRVSTARRRMESGSPEEDRASNASSEPTHGRPSGASQSSVPPFRYPERHGAISTAATAGSGSNVASFYSGRRSERDRDTTDGRSDAAQAGSERSSTVAVDLGSIHPSSAAQQRRNQDLDDEDELPRTSRTRRRTPNPTDQAGAAVRRRGVSPQAAEGSRLVREEAAPPPATATTSTTSKALDPTAAGDPKHPTTQEEQQLSREEAFLKEFEGTDIPYSTSRYSSSRASPNSALPPGFGAHLGATSVSRWAVGMLSTLNAETQRDGNPLRPPQQPSAVNPRGASSTEEPASLGRRDESAHSNYTLHSYQSGGNLAQHWSEEDLSQVNGKVSIALVSPCTTLDYESLISMARKYRCQRVVLVPPGDGSLNASGSTSPDSKNGASSAARLRALQLSRAGIQSVNRPSNGSQPNLNDSGSGLGGDRDVDISRVADVRAYVRRLSEGAGSSSLVISPLASRSRPTDSAARTTPPLSASNSLSGGRGASSTYPVASSWQQGGSPGAIGAARIPTVAIHKTKTAGAVPLHRFEHPPEAIYVVSKTEPITKHDSEVKDSPEFLRAVAQEEKDLGWCDYHVYLSPNNAMNGIVSLLSCTLHDRLRKVDPELAKQAQSPPSSARGLRLRGTNSSGLLE